VTARAGDAHAHRASKATELGWGQMPATRREGEVGRMVLHEREEGSDALKTVKAN